MLLDRPQGVVAVARESNYDDTALCEHARDGIEDGRVVVGDDAGDLSACSLFGILARECRHATAA
jgi:hypothetical protein